MKTIHLSIKLSTPKTINKVLQFWDNANKEDVGICEKAQQSLKIKPYLVERLCYNFILCSSYFSKNLMPLATG